MARRATTCIEMAPGGSAVIHELSGRWFDPGHRRQMHGVRRECVRSESARSAPAAVTTPARTSGGTVLFDDSWVHRSIRRSGTCTTGSVTVQSKSTAWFLATSASPAASSMGPRSMSRSRRLAAGAVVEHYTSWQIAQKTAPFEYGTVEVRAKEPGGTGVWPTIFLLGYRWQPSQQPPPVLLVRTGRSAAGPRSTSPSSWPMRERKSTTSCTSRPPGATVQAPLHTMQPQRFMVYRLQWSANA